MLCKSQRGGESTLEQVILLIYSVTAVFDARRTRIGDTWRGLPITTHRLRSRSVQTFVRIKCIVATCQPNACNPRLIGGLRAHATLVRTVMT